MKYVSFRLFNELRKRLEYFLEVKLIFRSTMHSAGYSYKRAILIFSVGLIILLVAMFTGRIHHVPFGYLTKDMATVLKGPSYIGIISSFGILVWFSTGAIALFSFFLNRLNNPKQSKGFLFTSAILFFMLGMDDLLLFHEGTYELYFFLIYFLLISIYFFWFFELFLKSTGFIFFILSMVFFSLSLFMDMDFIHMGYTDMFFLLEDGSKFIGIIFWSVFIIVYCFDLLRQKLTVIDDANSILAVEIQGAIPDLEFSKN